MTDNAKQLYNELSKRGRFFDTEEAFEKELQTEEGAKFYYDVASKEGLWMDTFEGFKSDIFGDEQPKKESEDGWVKRTINYIQNAQPFAHNIEEDKKAAGEEAARQVRISTGLTEKDKKDMAELASLQKKAASPVVVDENGIFHVPEPVYDQYGMPTGMTKPTNPELEKQITAKKSQMSSYLTRGEENLESIQANAIERALGTEDGKKLQTTIYNKYVEEFKNSEAYKTMMNDFYAGKATEDDIKTFFQETYGSKINGEFYSAIASDGGMMHDYIIDAENKLKTKLAAEDAYGLKREVDEAKEEQSKQYATEYNEKYKKAFGVYPYEDPLRDLHAKGFSVSGSHINPPAEGNLAYASQFNDKALTLIDAVNNDKEFLGGLGDAVTDKDTWDLGIGEIARSTSLMNVLDKVERDEELTKDEQLMFDAALNYFAVSAYYSDKVGRGYKAGQTTGASLPFMIQFVVSSGTTAAIDGALKAGASAVTKKIVNAMIKGGRKKLAKVVASDASKMVGKAIGGAVVSGIDAALLTSTFGLGKIEAGTLQREIGQVRTDFDSRTNQLKYEGRENQQTREEARKNAIIDTYVEYFSEMALTNTLSPVGSYLSGTKMFKDIAKGDVVGTLVDIWNNPVWKSIRQSTKFGSLPEEVLEEELGGLLRLAASDVNTAKEAGLDLDSQIDIVLGLAPTSIFFGVVGAASHYGTLWSGKREFRASLTTEEEKQLFDKLMKESRSGQFGDLAHDLIRTIVQDTHMSQEQKKKSISTIVSEYHDLLSKEAQQLADQVTVEGNERIIDDYISQARYGASDNIYQTIDNRGRVVVISDGKIEFNRVRVGKGYYLVADPNKSEGKVKVRYVNNNGTLTDEIDINVADLTAPVTELGVDEFKRFKLAQSNAVSSDQEAFEFEDGMYNTSTGEYIDTKEAYEKKKAEEAANRAPVVDTKAHKVNETITVTINGEKKTVRIISGNLTQNEDGSIKGGTISISVDGSPVTGERKKEIISQISDLFKAEHAKAVEEFNQRQAAENAPVEATPIVSDEDKAVAETEAQREAEKQSILASAQEKKAKKYTPEEAVVVLMEQGNDVASRLVGSRINKLRTQIDEINADENKDELEKWEDSKELSDQLAAYEAAVAKWLGQETLDEINAARTAATQAAVATPEVEPAPTPVVEPVPTPVVAQEPVPETIPAEEPAPAVEPEEVQPVIATEEIEEPVVTTEEEGEEGTEEQVGQEKEPVDLSSYDIVFVRQDWRVDIARRDENGELRFVDSGKKVGGSWRVMDNKFLVYYNGTPCYVLTTVKDVKAFPNSVTIVAQDYTGNKLKVSKWTLKDAEGKKLLKTGAEIQEENIRNNYKSLDDFMNEVVYANPKTGIKLTLGQLLSIPAIQKNRGLRGKPLYAFQVEQFLNDNASKEDRAEILKNIRHRISEIAGTWNAYVRINNLADVVTEDNMTDFYRSMKQAGGYKSNGLKIQTQDFEALNSNDITKNPILQMLVMMDQAKQLGSFSTDVDMSSVDNFSTIGQEDINVKEMSSEEIISEIRDIETDRAKSNNNSISKNRYNALKRELKKRGEGSKNEEKTEVVLDSVSTDDLFGDVIMLAHRINDKERPELLRAAAQAALDGRIDDTSYDDIFPLYIKLELLRNNTSNDNTKDNILTVMSAIERSKHADAISEAKRQLAEAANERDARQSAQVADTVEAATEAEDVAEEPEISQEEQVDTTEPDVEVSTTTELPDEQKDAKTLKQEIEQLSEQLNSLDMDQEEEFDSIIAQIQSKNEILERRGKGYKEEKSNSTKSLPRGIEQDSISGADFAVGNIAESSASQEAKELALASEIQSLADSEDIEVMNITAEQIEGSAPLMTSNGVIYGYALGNKIYLTPNGMNSNTPVHEYTHIWAKAMQKHNPKAWKSIVEQLKKAEALWDEVVNDPNYENIKNNEDAVASEVLSRYSGHNGAIKLEEEAERVVIEYKGMEKGLKVKALINRVKKALNQFWSWVGKDLFKIESFESIESIADRVLYDMLNNTQLNLDKSDRNPTNFDKKFKKMQETLDKGGKNVLSLQEISELTDTLEDDLRQGNKPLVFERIPFEALQKMSANERTLAEVLTIVAQKSRRTSRAVERNSEEVTPEERQSRDGSNRQMEFDIRQYAKEKGIWLNDPIAELTEMYGAPIGEGQESVVWADGKRGVVIKAKASELYETIEELLEGIVLNNLLLPQNNQHVIAFGYDKDGMFRVIYETPYVELGDDIVSQEKKDSHMESLGFYKIGDNIYSNGVYEVRDLHDQNIVNDSEGNVQITDAVIKWEAGEHYREAMPDELERDEKNEEKLDNWVDNGIEFMVGPAPTSSTPTDPAVFDTQAANRLIVKTQKYLAKVANPNVELPEEFSALRKFIAEAFDRTEGIRWMMDSIEKYRRENNLPELGEGFDVRTMVETMESKVQNETKTYIRNIENRLRNNIHKLEKRLEGTSFYKKYKTEKIKNQSGEYVTLTPLQFIERYLIARDSIEREELTGNPRGAADFYQRMGVDMVEFVKGFHSALFPTAEKKKELDELWDSVRAATDVVIDRGWESGFISYDEYQDYKKRKFYVPERDFAEVETNKDIAVEELSYHGRGSNKLSAMKQAKGGESLAASVLANICLLARDAILKANKNIVKKSMYDLLRANTDWCREYHIPIPHQIWYVKNPDGSVTRMTDGPTSEQKKQMREIKSDIRKLEDEIRSLTALRDGATVQSVKDAYDADIKDLEDEIEMLRGMMPYLDEYDTRNQIFLDGATRSASTVVVYVDGVPTEMLFPNMSIVAKALNGTFNKEGKLEGAERWKNAMSAAMTVYNPAFFTVNVARDIPFIMTKGFAEYGVMFPIRFIAELGKKLLTLDLWKIAWTGDATSIKNEHLKAFYEGGANTGYTSTPDLKKLKDATKGWSKNTAITWSNVGDVLSYLNTFSEVWTRAAAYSVVRQMGRSNEEGLRAAKNLSVNFNRKGLGNKFMNAFGSISLFMNAAIQGSCGWLRAFSGNEKSFAGKALHATRAALGFMFAPAFAGFIDTLCNPDDDENLKWYSDYDRDNYCLFGDVRIPLNEQIKPFWVMGVNIALAMQGRRSTEQVIDSIVSSIFTNLVPLPPVINESIVMAVNGVTGTKDIDLFDIPANLITPQAIGGVYDLANGVNFMGSKLEFDTGDKPQFIFSENEALTSRLLAKSMYYIGGGSKDVKSKTRDDGKEILFDVNPKQVTAITSLIPVGSTYKDIAELLTRRIAEKDFGSPEDYATIRRFYKPREEEIAMYNIVKEAKAIVKRNSEIKANMNAQLKGGEISGNEAMSAEAKRRYVNAMSDAEIKEMQAYIKAYEVQSVAKRAREFGLTEEEFLNSLPEDTKKMIKDIDTRRPEIARKLLTMVRDYKDIEVNNMTLEQGLGLEE